MKKIIKIMMMMLVAVAFNSVTGGMLASTVGVQPLIGAAVMNGVAAVAGSQIPAGALGDGMYTEVWTGYIVKAMRTAAEKLGWYNQIKSFDQYAENDVIHLVHIGVDPTVLINNTTYPLQIETLEDADKAVSLDKYQTRPTVITDDELYALSYDKIASVIERHREALDETKYKKAIHAIAPGSNGAKTPVILTTGETTSDGTRKMVTRKDIIAMKKKFDDMKVPLSGRVLVLCNDHVNDLLESDQKFADQYYNYTSGKISNMYGFEVYEYNECPYYDATTLQKIAYDANTTGKQHASVAFYAPRMMRANGTTKTYMSEAKNDPQNQQNLVNFRTYSICLPMKDECIGAIVSAAPAVEQEGQNDGPEVQEPEVENPVVPSISATNVAQFTKNGGTKHSSVTATGEWTVANDDENDDWFTVEKVDDDTICVVCSANSESEAPARSGSFTVALTSDNTVNTTVQVTQAANE